MHQAVWPTKAERLVWQADNIAFQNKYRELYRPEGRVDNPKLHDLLHLQETVEHFGSILNLDEMQGKTKF